jgi:hypothetical protein
VKWHAAPTELNNAAALRKLGTRGLRAGRSQVQILSRYKLPGSGVIRHRGAMDSRGAKGASGVQFLQSHEKRAWRCGADFARLFTPGPQRARSTRPEPRWSAPSCRRNPPSFRAAAPRTDAIRLVHAVNGERSATPRVDTRASRRRRSGADGVRRGEPEPPAASTSSRTVPRSRGQRCRPTVACNRPWFGGRRRAPVPRGAWSTAPRRAQRRALRRPASGRWRVGRRGFRRRRRQRRWCRSR